jgi:hypothetical protein
MRARDNPFATARVHRIRYRLPDGLEWEPLLARLQTLNWRGAIVGPEGAGKTTLLEDLAPKLIGRGWEPFWLRITREQPQFSRQTWRELSSGLCSRHIILFDGAEQLSRVSRWRFRLLARRAGGLVLTSHRPGLLPTLLECATTPELLAAFVGDLLNEPAEAHEAHARRLHRKHQGNLRDALRELYDLWSVRAQDSAEPRLPDADRRPDKRESSPLVV